MNNLIIDFIGYGAAIITNISIYPQAYEIYIIVNINNHEKLQGISLTMYILQSIGSLLWLIYAYYVKLYPIIAGAILRLVPSIYIIYNVYMYKPVVYSKPAIPQN